MAMLCLSCSTMLECQTVQKGSHHPTLSALIEATKLGCQICRQVSMQEIQSVTVELLKEQSEDEIECSMTYFFQQPEGANWRFVLEIEIGDEVIWNEFSLVPLEWEAEAGNDDDFSEFSSARFLKTHQPSGSSTGDPNVVSLASRWIDSCQKNHACGGETNASWVPKRLIDVTQLRPKLLVTANENLECSYATLSHCWGPNPSFHTLTAANFSDMCKGIPIETLAQSFQDAIATTRALGMRYIWIDSLCIIQSGDGSEEDWKEHAAAMLSIYANCSVNIAISHASNPQGGCFRKRDPTGIQPITVEWHAFLNDDNCVYSIVKTDLGGSVPTAQPLAQRAWVLQERLLSPRVLSFGPEQVFFECGEISLACEQYPGGIPLEALDSGYRAFSLPQVLTDEDKQGAWSQVLIDYTACSLSFPDKDKFVALAGIAKRMASYLNDEYVAGFFKSDLPQALLWFNDEAEKTYYRGPSWSWASMDGKLSWVSVPKQSHLLCKVLAVHVEPVDSNNRFGQIKHGEITLRGQYLRPRDNLGDGRYMRFPIAGELDDIRVTSYLDEKTSSTAVNQETVLLPVVRIMHENDFQFRIVGLVLRSCGQQYLRIGYWTVTDERVEETLNTVGEKSFTIV